jgi:hypothetical protein
LVTFFGGAKKVTSCRAAPGEVDVDRDSRQNMPRNARPALTLYCPTSRFTRTTCPIPISLPSQSVIDLPATNFGNTSSGHKNLIGTWYVSPNNNILPKDKKQQSNASPSTKSGQQ